MENSIQLSTTVVQVNGKTIQGYFLVYLVSKGLHNAKGMRKAGQLLKSMGVEHMRIYDTFVWTADIAAVDTYPDHGIEAVPAQPAEDKHDLDSVIKTFGAQFGIHQFRSIQSLGQVLLLIIAQSHSFDTPPNAHC